MEVALGDIRYPAPRARLSECLQLEERSPAGARGGSRASGAAREAQVSSEEGGARPPQPLRVHGGDAVLPVETSLPSVCCVPRGGRGGPSTEHLLCAPGRAGKAPAERRARPGGAAVDARPIKPWGPAVGGVEGTVEETGFIRIEIASAGAREGFWFSRSTGFRAWREWSGAGMGSAGRTAGARPTGRLCPQTAGPPQVFVLIAGVPFSWARGCGTAGGWDAIRGGLGGALRLDLSPKTVWEPCPCPGHSASVSPVPAAPGAWRRRGGGSSPHRAAFVPPAPHRLSLWPVPAQVFRERGMRWSQGPAGSAGGMAGRAGGSQGVCGVPGGGSLG